jgi:hypothetical protein
LKIDNEELAMINTTQHFMLVKASL